MFLHTRFNLGYVSSKGVSHKNIQPSNFRQLRGFLNTCGDSGVADEEEIETGCKRLDIKGFRKI